MDWIDVKDRLPDENKQVIAWAANGENQKANLMMTCSYLSDCFCFGTASHVMEGVTHWMEFPKPPIDEDDEIDDYIKSRIKVNMKKNR